MEEHGHGPGRQRGQSRELNSLSKNAWHQLYDRRSCPLRARPDEQSRVVTVTYGQTIEIPQVTESAGGRRTTPQTSQADSAGSIPVTRSHVKAQVGGNVSNLGLVFGGPVRAAGPLAGH